MNDIILINLFLNLKQPIINLRQFHQIALLF